MATGIFILLVQRLWDGSVGKCFPSGTHEDVGVGSEETEINPHQPIRRIFRILEVVPFSTNLKISEKYNFGDASTQQSMGACATLQNHQNLCWKNLIFLSLLWDELYGWNSRNWKKWGKISQILNAVTLSRPKRVFFSGKLFTLSCFCSVISHNHFLPDIVCWFTSCYNIFSSFQICYAW